MRAITAGKLYYNLADWDNNEDQIAELLRAPELASLPRVSRSPSSRRPQYQPAFLLNSLAPIQSDGSADRIERVDSMDLGSNKTPRAELLRAKSTR